MPRAWAAKKRKTASQNPVVQSGGKSIAKLDLSNLSPSERHYAELIAKDFADAGHGRVQQAAAVADAIAESNLDPTAVGDDGHSIGLFQANRDGGLGTGHSVATLENPQTNIRIALDAAERHSAFADAKTIDRAVGAFVSDVERPADTPGQTAERAQIAKQSLA